MGIGFRGKKEAIAFAQPIVTMASLRQPQQAKALEYGEGLEK